MEMDTTGTTEALRTLDDIHIAADRLFQAYLPRAMVGDAEAAKICDMFMGRVQDVLDAKAEER